jgi:hypothetical protein
MVRTEHSEDEPAATAEFWRAVRYLVEWAEGQPVEVVQPPLVTPPPEYRTAA